MRRVRIVWLVFCLPIFSSAVWAQQRIEYPASSYSGSREGLIYDLKHPDSFRRRQAAELAGRNRLREVLPQLTELQKDPEAEVRRAMVSSLDSLLDARAGATLAVMLEDGDRDIRQKAIRALVNVYLGQDSSSLGSAMRHVGAVFNPRVDANNSVIEPDVEVAPGVIPGLARCLRDPYPPIRKDAAQALGILRGKAAVEEMARASREETDKAVLKEQLRSFAKLGDPAPAPQAMALLRHEDPSIQEEAIFTLGALRDKSAVAELTQIYQSGTGERRRILRVIPASRSDLLVIRSLQAMAMIGAAESRNLFSEALTHVDSRYRQAGAEGLARIRTPDLAPTLVTLKAREQSNDAKMAMSFALFRAGQKENLEELVAAAAGGQEDSAGYLAEFQGPEVPMLYPFLGSENAKTRAVAAEVIGLTGDASALPQLEPLTKDRDVQVLAAAVKAQRRIQARSRK